jgi:hypothetical protein
MPRQDFFVHRDSFGTFGSKSSIYLERGNLRVVSIDAGKSVIAYSVYQRTPRGEAALTIVPGFYLGDLDPTESGERRMKTESISPELRELVSNVLREEGYGGLMHFW